MYFCIGIPGPFQPGLGTVHTPAGGAECCFCFSPAHKAPDTSVVLQ